MVSSRIGKLQLTHAIDGKSTHAVEENFASYQTASSLFEASGARPHSKRSLEYWIAIAPSLREHVGPCSTVLRLPCHMGPIQPAPCVS
jgi:hypothetical protein